MNMKIKQFLKELPLKGLEYMVVKLAEESIRNPSEAGIEKNYINVLTVNYDFEVLEATPFSRRIIVSPFCVLAEEPKILSKFLIATKCDYDGGILIDIDYSKVPFPEDGDFYGYGVFDRDSKLSRNDVPKLVEHLIPEKFNDLTLFEGWEDAKAFIREKGIKPRYKI